VILVEYSLIQAASDNARQQVIAEEDQKIYEILDYIVTHCNNKEHVGYDGLISSCVDCVIKTVMDI
jgi:hypothetical protein